MGNTVLQPSEEYD